MKHSILAAAALALASCATPVVDPPAQQAWQCNADDARSLVGSHRGAVLFPQDANVRFVCNECAMTRDYRSDRLTIFYDEASGTITRVQCV